MTSSRVGEIRGVQTPRVEHVPTSAFTDLGDDTIELCRAVGLNLDPWQQYVVRGMLGERLDNKYSASRVGVVVPRQQGKGVILEARALAGMFLMHEPFIIWTAHELKTAQAAFLRLRSWIDGAPDLAKHVRQYYTGNTENSIILNDGRALRFLARSQGSGRGFTASTLILDEAYALKHSQLAALLPTLSTASNPQTIYASSAGMPDSEVLADLRAEGMTGKGKALAYFEWSAPDDADTDDVDALRVANPGLGTRLSLDHVATERAAMDEETFRRERLGIWAKIGGDSVISPSLWAGVCDPDSMTGRELWFAVDVPPTRDGASIAVASRRDDGVVHVELVDRQVGTSWVADRLAELQERWSPRGIIIEAGSQAGVLIPELRRKRVKVRQVSARDYQQACGMFFDAVKRGEIAHTGQVELEEAVSGAQFKFVGDSLFKWARSNVAVDISPLVAVSLALFGVNTDKRSDKPREAGSGWRVVAL